MKVFKRSGNLEDFDLSKIETAVRKAYAAKEKEVDNKVIEEIDLLPNKFINSSVLSVDSIQDEVEKILIDLAPYDVAKAYILYREQHKESRFIRERIDYMTKYSQSTDNAASSSETDANSNVSMKNVANLEGEVYKTTNRVIQRQRMKDKLNELYPEVAKQYEEDLNHHIIYTHDEASTPVLKYYCCAVTLYPLMLEGVGNIDGVTPSAPNDIQSFSGQVTNLAFLLSSQCKGAVAFGDYFVALNYYVIKEFGNDWYDNLDTVVTNEKVVSRTISYYIKKGMKQFIYGINQPAGNRSYNSPFSNVSYYDRVYFNSLFEDFRYPDGTRPEWKAIDTLQRMFVQLHRELRLIKPLTFPVSSFALVHDNFEFLDKEYADLCAEEWSKGSSHFLYNSDNPSALASCCRVLNEISDNTFSSTTGLSGIMTGSVNVITLNLNRIVQDWARANGICDEKNKNYSTVDSMPAEERYSCVFVNDPYDRMGFKRHLVNILERVYKYHIAFKTMLYDMEDKGMFAASNGGYIYMSKLFSTIGIIGYCEAAQYLGLKVGNNEEYIRFLEFIGNIIKEQNRLHSIKDNKRPFIFNCEAIPGESAGIKFYNWDKEDGYIVPEDQVLYNCYFYNPWDETSVLDKLALHGRRVVGAMSGGQAAHINLDSHLSKAQYLKLMDIAIKNGTNYFTFNIPMTECKDCGHVVNAPIKVCSKCSSSNLKYWTRIIGYLTAVDSWSKERQIDFSKRFYPNLKDRYGKDW